MPRSRFYPYREKNKENNKAKPRSNKTTSNGVSEEELTVAIRTACDRYPLDGNQWIRIILRCEFNLYVSQKRVNNMMNKLDLSQKRSSMSIKRKIRR